MLCYKQKHLFILYKEVFFMYKDLQAGDIIGVKRFLYSHYAVYVGDNTVIHYSGEKGDFVGKKTVRYGTMNEFLDGKKEFFELVFPQKHQKPDKEARYETQSITYKLYSPEETVLRAKSRIGEDKYNLALNNCEHFAIWCKTGVSESYQVKRVLSGVVKIVEKMYNV